MAGFAKLPITQGEKRGFVALWLAVTSKATRKRLEHYKNPLKGIKISKGNWCRISKMLVGKSRLKDDKAIFQP
jgi:hypothetical protein